MFGRKLKRENNILTKRVQELEEMLCPNKMHRWEYKENSCTCAKCKKEWTSGSPNILIIGASVINRARKFYHPKE